MKIYAISLLTAASKGKEMILKIEIQNEVGDSWKLLQVDGIDYLKNPITCKNPLDICADIKLLSKLEGWDFRNDYSYNIIKYTLGGTVKSIAFDTVAYLCNDAGKTVDKIEGQ